MPPLVHRFAGGAGLIPAGGSILHSPPRRRKKLNTQVTISFVVALPGREKGKAGDCSPAFAK